MEERNHKQHHHQVSDPTPLSMNNSGTPERELSVSTRRGSPNLPDHHGVKDAKIQDTSLQVGVDGAVARRPRSTCGHVQVTKDSTHMPARR